MTATSAQSVKEVEDEAAAWLIKRDAGPWTDSDQADLDRWLEASTANVVAFVRLETAWQRMHRLKALGAGTPPGAVPSPDEWQLSPIFKPGREEAAPRSSQDRETSATGASKRFRWALAASVLLAIIASAWYLRPLEPSYRTPVGGIASVPMTDGSKIILNTDSKIRLAVTATERRVELKQGEAFFDVAKDPNRPFVVSAGDKRVIAVGTAFSVYRNKDDVRVVVAEGKVRIENDDRKDLLLPAGSVARSHRGQVTLEQKPLPQVEENLSWRSGFLTFRETTLGEAIREFNRYNDRKIIIEDPDIAAIRLSGKFQATQYEAFIRLLEDSFPVRVHSVDGSILLTAR